MVNFNFGLGTSTAQDDTASAEQSTTTAGDTGTTPPTDTGATPVTNDTGATQTPAATNPFETNIPAADENIFVTPPESNTPVSQPVTEAPVVPTEETSNTTPESVNIFEKPVPKADEMTQPQEPVVSTENVATETEEPVSDQNQSDLEPLEPIFPDTPAPAVEPIPQDLEPAAPTEVKPEPVLVEASDSVVNPFSADTPSLGNVEETSAQDVPAVKEDISDVEFNPFSEDGAKPVVEEPVAEPMGSDDTSSTEEPGLGFNPFAETDSEVTSTDSVENDSAVETEELEPEMPTADSTDESVAVPETVDPESFSPFEDDTEETVNDDDDDLVDSEESEDSDLPTEELVPMFGDDDDGDDDEDLSPTNTSADPLQTLTAVKNDIETYISQQEADIADLNADIDYHKDEIKDLRHQIKEKQKHIKEKKEEFENMIKDIEKTLATKFTIKK
ncbi:hypothetical protein CSB37_04135 [bacterium DOLZORAL124_38_8]|nr:MAG: hypothetical protein CSB37_04135 [bacterium DOLZORAL124_38_8]